MKPRKTNVLRVHLDFQIKFDSDFDGVGAIGHFNFIDAIRNYLIDRNQAARDFGVVGRPLPAELLKDARTMMTLSSAQAAGKKKR